MNPYYGRAAYLKSVVELRQLPPEQGFEAAFAGRSNAGKSSALNTLTGINGLARVSKQPGRTQAINYFETKRTVQRVREDCETELQRDMELEFLKEKCTALQN